MTGFFRTADSLTIPVIPARVVHVGEDFWHRVPVLRGAGMAVEECRGIDDLRLWLKAGTETDAVLLAASPMFHPAPAREMVRKTVKCPVILFSTGAMEAERYDLVVHPLTDPTAWLAEIEELIERGRQIRAESRATGEISEQLRRESAEAVRQYQEQQARAKRLIRGDGIPLRKMDGE